VRIVEASTVLLAGRRLAVTSFGRLGTGHHGLRFSLKRRMANRFPYSLMGFVPHHAWAWFELAKMERLENEQSTLDFFGPWSGPRELQHWF